MAIRFAVANGNWSNTSTWNGGTLPTSADDVFSNNFTVTVDQPITVITLRTTSNTSPAITAGGGFVATNGNNIICTGTTINGLNRGFVHGTTTVLTVSGTASLSISGDIVPSEVNASNIGTITISGTGTINIVGNINGSLVSPNGSYGLNITSAATVNLTGNITTSPVGGGSGQVGINMSAPATLNITGNLTSNLGRCVQTSNVAPNISVIGNLTVNIGTQCILLNSSLAFAISVTGNVSGTNVPAITSNNDAPGIVTVAGNITNFNSYLAINCPRIRISPTISQSWTFQTSGTNRQLLTTNAFTDYPSVNDVRFGVTYSNSGSLTGLARIPDPNSVLFGVPVGPTATGLAISSRSQFITDMGALLAAYNG